MIPLHCSDASSEAFFVSCNCRRWNSQPLILFSRHGNLELFYPVLIHLLKVGVVFFPRYGLFLKPFIPFRLFLCRRIHSGINGIEGLCIEGYIFVEKAEKSVVPQIVHAVGTGHKFIIILPRLI